MNEKIINGVKVSEVQKIIDEMVSKRKKGQQPVDEKVVSAYEDTKKNRHIKNQSSEGWLKKLV